MAINDKSFQKFDIKSTMLREYFDISGIFPACFLYNNYNPEIDQN